MSYIWEHSFGSGNTKNRAGTFSSCSQAREGQAKQAKIIEDLNWATQAEISRNVVKALNKPPNGRFLSRY